MKCVWIALAAARIVLAADFALQDYLPPDTKVVMGLRVRALTESSLFQETSTSAGAKTLSDNWTRLAAFTGFDPLRDIDEVLLTSAADRENAPALLVLRGRFHLNQLGAGAERYHGVAIQTSIGNTSIGQTSIGNSIPKTGTSLLALLDETTALAGEAPVVKAAIDRRGQPVAYDAALVARVASLRERFDIWGTGERPQGFVAPGGQNDQLGSIDRFEFGIRITNGLELGAQIHARSPKDAEKLAASLGMLQMMAKAQSDSAKFDVKLEDGTLKLSFSVSEEEIKKAIAAQRTQTQFKVTGQPATVTPATISLTTTPGGTSVLTLPGKR